MRMRLRSGTRQVASLIQGLGAHPFGSWLPKGDENKGWMWIRDALPKAFPPAGAFSWRTNASAPGVVR